MNDRFELDIEAERNSVIAGGVADPRHRGDLLPCESCGGAIPMGTQAGRCWPCEMTAAPKRPKPPAGPPGDTWDDIPDAKNVRVW